MGDGQQGDRRSEGRRAEEERIVEVQKRLIGHEEKVELVVAIEDQLGRRTQVEQRDEVALRIEQQAQHRRAQELEQQLGITQPLAFERFEIERPEKSGLVIAQWWSW